jgi:hypothetical protein
MKISPLISIIIPCYNQANFLGEALQSVSNQTYSNWECIIVNDGSNDDSGDIARKLVSKDERFHYFHQDNKGVSSARNYGIAKSNGTYIQFLDADDFLEKSKLESSLQQLILTDDGKAKLVISDFRMFTSNPYKTSDPFCNLNYHLFNFESLLYKWNESFSIPIHCGLFEVSLFEKIRFPENLTAQEDWIVWVKIFQTGCKVFFLDEPLALYRINPISRTMTKSLYEDQMKAYEYFKTIVTEDEFHKLSSVLISRYYKSSENFKYKLRTSKNSNTYQTGLLVKKVLNKLGVLKIVNSLFPLVYKFKTKL